MPNVEPPKEKLVEISKLCSEQRWNQAAQTAASLVDEFPKCIPLYQACGVSHANLGNHDIAIEMYQNILRLKKDNVHALNNIGVLLKLKQNYKGALTYFSRALQVNPDFAEAHNNLGNLYSDKGEINVSINCYAKALQADKYFTRARLNLSIAYLAGANVPTAKRILKDGLKLDPKNAELYWHLVGCANTLTEAKLCLADCLKYGGNEEASLMANTIDIFQKKTHEPTSAKFNDTTKAFARSVKWVLKLENRPRLMFHRWAMFDYAVASSNKRRPFYEFGVWRGTSFKYLLKNLKNGFGFDTFTGLPEDWHEEQKGSYTSDGIVPDLNGGQFIVGTFETTLPEFFKTTRPMASIINFDADLYSSTICALNNCNSVIDSETIIIFDQFLMNENWEQDEYKALTEFCTNRDYRYEVLAVSFTTKQVIIRLLK